MEKFLTVSLISLMLTFSVSAGTDGENSLSKKNPNSVKDCFENINRATFKFNQVLDGAIIEPIAKAYRVLPSPIRAGTGNALNNLSSLVTIPNNVLQGELKKAGVNTARFIVNTTIGVVGIFDVAQKIGFTDYEKEDYGQTLGTMGVGPGCYLILPILGPSTVRDTAGSFINVLGGDPWYNASAGGNNHYLNDSDYITAKVLTGIDFRAKNIDSFKNLEKNSMDFYASVKSLYLQDRQQKIMNTKSKANIEIIYDDGDWEEIESK